MFFDYCICRLCNYQKFNLDRVLFEVPQLGQNSQPLPADKFETLALTELKTIKCTMFKHFNLHSIDGWFTDKFATAVSQMKGRKMALTNFVKTIICAINNIIFIKSSCFAEKSVNKTCL